MEQEEPRKAENVPKRPWTSDPARRERLAALMQSRTKLSASEAVRLREVFPEILFAHYKMVWKELWKRRLKGDEAEDLLQETFLVLYHQIVEEGFPGSVRGMLRSILRGKLKNYVRARKRAPESVCIPSSGSEKPGSEPDVERALDLRELSVRLLPRLSQEHQEVVGQVILNGLSHGDAAIALDLPEGTVKSRMIAAKRELMALAKLFLPPSQRESP